MVYYILISKMMFVYGIFYSGMNNDDKRIAASECSTRAALRCSKIQNWLLAIFFVTATGLIWVHYYLLTAGKFPGTLTFGEATAYLVISLIKFASCIAILVVFLSIYGQFMKEYRKEYHNQQELQA